MRFFHNTKLVKNKKSILNIGNMNKPILRAEHEFQIFVKLITGKTITLDVWTSYFIEDVKLMIYNKMKKEERESYDLSLVYLTCQSKKLISSDFSRWYKLSDYNIQKNDTIWLNFRLRGGGKRGHVIKTAVKSKTADKTLPSDVKSLHQRVRPQRGDQPHYLRELHVDVEDGADQRS